MDRGLPKRVYSNNKRKLSSEDPFIARILGQNGTHHQVPEANRRHVMSNLHQPSTSAAAAAVRIDKICILTLIVLFIISLIKIVQQARVQQRTTCEVPAKRQNTSAELLTTFPNKQISHLRRQQQQLLPVNIATNTKHFNLFNF
jgi:hypothetical protein